MYIDGEGIDLYYSSQNSGFDYNGKMKNLNSVYHMGKLPKIKNITDKNEFIPESQIQD